MTTTMLFFIFQTLTLNPTNNLQQGDTVVAVLARVSDHIQWPSAKDEAFVKLDQSHYFFTLRVPKKQIGSDDDDDDEKGKIKSDEFELLNYGLMLASKGKEGLLLEFDKVLERYSTFTVQEVKEGWELIEGNKVAREMSLEEMEKKRELMEESSAAYWTMLAPNVEEYSSSIARMIAIGLGYFVWGDEFLKKWMGKSSNLVISFGAMRRVKRFKFFMANCGVKKMTKMPEKMATGILSRVVKVSGFFTSSIVNSKAGKKFFSLLPEEIVPAFLDGFRSTTSFTTTIPFEGFISKSISHNCRTRSILSNGPIKKAIRSLD
ncbi:hypothetical protein K2173_010048 [Erythroxylum novogranatense]|uniref:Uncharacterized protein n=1 Tax=Erythroxylum novogranatense TaxID=1862640 RepID=A0AAV8S5A9_9ROSI|nr:hypothetical protein K2173_010048 [Erythroxylum novogranatense]